MKIQAKNYVAQILSLAEKSSRYRGTPEDAERIYKAARALKNAVHFSLPPNGRVLESRTPLAEGMEGCLRLPYPSITMEFEMPVSPEELEEASVGGQPFNKVVIFAYEFSEVVDDSEYTQVHFMAWVHQIDKNGRPIGWALPNGVIGLPVYWDDVETEDGNYRMPLLGTRVYGKGVGVIHEVSDLEPAEQLWFGWFTGVLIDFLAALACSNVSNEVIQAADPALNARRVRKGKLPLLETRCLTIVVPGNKPYRVEDSDGDGDHERNSPRQHLRRGHIRRLSDDRRIWVNSCIVGDPSKGRIEKSYAVRSAA